MQSEDSVLHVSFIRIIFVFYLDGMILDDNRLE